MNIKIIKECSDFLKESEGNPLIRRLPRRGRDSRKIKVRWKKSVSEFDRHFNNVFSDYPDLRQRCIFAHGEKGLYESSDDSVDDFYIFPVDGYKYLYCPNVDDSTKIFSESMDKFREMLPEPQAIKVLSDALQYSYKSSNLAEGIREGSEIIIYGVPYYYAIRTSTVKKYSTLFSL